MYVVLAVLAMPAASLGQEPAERKVDFHRHVQPLLESRCYACHGPEKQKGHLRLDRREAALRGGDSGLPVIGAAEDNVLLARIISDDPNEVMPPPEADTPLTESQIDLLRRWVRQGAVWPEREPHADAGRLPVWVLVLVEFWEDTVAPHRVYLFVWLGAFALIEAARRLALRRIRRGHTPGAIGRRLASIGVGTHLGVIAAVLVAGMYAQNARLRAQLAELRATPPVAVINERAVFGYPPRPFHPGHPPRLGGVYYRGNCERNGALYNGGNYLTATIEIALVDGDGRAVQIGDTVAGRPLALRVDMVRAPHTADALFSQALIDRVCLTRQLPDSQQKPADTPVPFTTVEAGQRWRAVYPLPPMPTDAETAPLVIYVYHGAEWRGDALTRGERHYGIVCDLRLEGDRLAAGSEVWMNALFWTSAVQTPVDPALLPFREWFDHEPIAPIEGGNTSDAKLLGVEEHVDPRTGEPRRR